ncbi:hypothetical protein CKAH01_07400 [Colletotrichum kahawae]|uniref:Uncharacterized protein n=1 Tax=Colletotrichum kahawae TaxID=34407 RepID=A0AAD9Y5S1_COLKA|nr:hypothetical protein CKAH01_07400 [Colletotrichum kahawae]
MFCPTTVSCVLHLPRVAVRKIAHEKFRISQNERFAEGLSSKQAGREFGRDGAHPSSERHDPPRYPVSERRRPEGGLCASGQGSKTLGLHWARESSVGVQVCRILASVEEVEVEVKVQGDKVKPSRSRSKFGLWLRSLGHPLPQGREVPASSRRWLRPTFHLPRRRCIASPVFSGLTHHMCLRLKELATACPLLLHTSYRERTTNPRTPRKEEGASVIPVVEKAGRLVSFVHKAGQPLDRKLIFLHLPSWAFTFQVQDHPPDQHLV